MIRFAGLSVTGEKENRVNEDRIVINGRLQDIFSDDASPLLFAAVMDGVSGEAYGDDAAQLAAERMSGLAGDAAQEDIRHAVAEANQAILRAQTADAAHARMATTVAGLAIHGEDYLAFNLGDSRVYHLGVYFSQMTRDHTYRRMMQDATGGTADIPQERSHMITRYLGSADGDQPEILECRDKVRPSDMFLLCSDGLHDVLTDEYLEGMLRANTGPLQDLCEELVRQALEKGSRDNISVILCKVEESL